MIMISKTFHNIKMHYLPFFFCGIRFSKEPFLIMYIIRNKVLFLILSVVGTSKLLFKLYVCTCKMRVQAFNNSFIGTRSFREYREHYFEIIFQELLYYEMISKS